MEWRLKGGPLKTKLKTMAVFSIFALGYSMFIEQYGLLHLDFGMNSGPSMSHTNAKFRMMSDLHMGMKEGT